jgi:lipid A ethanolaminephosphotransferase
MSRLAFPSSRLAAPSAAAGGSGAREAAASRWTIAASVEQLVVAASLFWALSANRVFLGAALKGRAVADPATWGFAAAILVLLLGTHALVLALVCNRWTVKPVLALLLVATASASYYITHYGVYLDPTMLRNVLHTNPAEATALLSGALALHLALYAGAPLLLLWRVRIVRHGWLRAGARRIAFVALTLVLLVATLWSVFQPLASLTRSQRELRYLVTPANFLWSIGAVAAADARGAARARQPIGEDAAPGPSWAQRTKPLVLVLVLGETARAANWGLSGYARQTTPQLARLPVINFGQVDACGTSTEVSVPCLFAPVGRRDYDEARIRGQQSLMHVAARAGVGVHWRDNQSGCKGVCEGLPRDSVLSLNPAGLCADGHCLDEGLLRDLDQRLAGARGTQLWVLHTMGNHGPSYFRRYPAAFAQFQPECRHDDLRRCSTQEVINAYDNALLYTDHVLASTIAKLQARAAQVDSALIYVSDHGESLGEHGLFLHGMPHAIAPQVQTRVPMVMWFSAGFERGAGLARGCLVAELQRRAAQPAAHDHLFHTVLGLLDVRTALREDAWDLVHACRGGDLH